MVQQGFGFCLDTGDTPEFIILANTAEQAAQALGASIVDVPPKRAWPVWTIAFPSSLFHTPSPEEAQEHGEENWVYQKDPLLLLLTPSNEREVRAWLVALPVWTLGELK